MFCGFSKCWPLESWFNFNGGAQGHVCLCVCWCRCACVCVCVLTSPQRFGAGFINHKHEPMDPVTLCRYVCLLSSVKSKETQEEETDTCVQDISLCGQGCWNMSLSNVIMVTTLSLSGFFVATSGVRKACSLSWRQNLSQAFVWENDWNSCYLTCLMGRIRASQRGRLSFLSLVVFPFQPLFFKSLQNIQKRIQKVAVFACRSSAPVWPLHSLAWLKSYLPLARRPLILLMPSSGSGAQSFSLLTNKLAFVLEWLHPSSFGPRLLEKLEENSQWNKEDMQLDGSHVEPRGIGVDWTKANTIFFGSNCFRSKFGQVKHPTGGKCNPFILFINNVTSIFKQLRFKQSTKNSDFDV